MRRRLDLDSLPFLEPDGMSVAGFEADGAKVAGRRRGGEESEGEEMGSFQPSSWVSGNSTVDGRSGGGAEGGDYLARARYLSGGRKGLKAGGGGDAVSIRTVRGKQRGSSSIPDGDEEANLSLADLRRRLGKLERAIGGLRHGLTSESRPSEIVRRSRSVQYSQLIQRDTLSSQPRRKTSARMRRVPYLWS